MYFIIVILKTKKYLQTQCESGQTDDVTVPLFMLC